MTETNVKEDKHITYDSIKIGLASPEKKIGRAHV